MDIAFIGFLVFGFVAMLSAYVMEGGVLGALVTPTAAIIVFGGTFAAAGLSFPFSTIKRLGAILGVVLKGTHHDGVSIVKFFYDICQTTRKNGLLSIEEEINNKTDINPIAKKGLLMIVDGYDADLIRNTLEIEAEVISERHKEGAAVFESAGAYAPTMGIIGTVMGLVHVLGSLSDPSTLGPKIAVAFLATLYGVFSANIIFLPIGSRLKEMNKEEELINMMVIEGVLEVQAGTHPAAVSVLN
jgi:chemotaxis protein MotA